MLTGQLMECQPGLKEVRVRNNFKMKVLDYLFFGIYNSYYKDGNYKNDVPWYGGLIIFTGVFFCNVFTLMVVVLDGGPISKSFWYIIGLVCLATSYLLFIRNKRYEIIYNEMSKLSRPKRLLNKVLSWVYVIGSFVLMMSLIIVEKHFK